MVKKNETISVAFRLEASLLERLDNHATRMTEQIPGMKFSRADALRVLVTRALDVAEAEDRKRR